MTGNKSNNPPSVAGKKGFSLISNEKFRQLYAALLQCEILDQRLSSFPQSASGYEQWSGRKASSAALAACLRRGDTVTSTPRGILTNYLHTGSINCAEKNRTPQDQLIGANEDALAHKLKKRGNVTAVFAPTPQPAIVREIFTPAAKKSLPVLYIFEGGTPQAELCHDIPVIRVDASDTVAAYRVVYESTARARQGGGPTIIECVPWPGDPQASSPLLKLEQYLTGRKLFRPRWKSELEQKYADEIDQAIKSLSPMYTHGTNAVA